jgi:hypothetical protein
LSLPARVFAAVVLLTLAACTSYLDARAESALRQALARVVGPAASYEVHVSGASVDATRFEHVGFVGQRIARENAPVLDRLELELRGVVLDRAEKRLVALADSRGVLQVRASDLNDYLRRSASWIEDPAVVLSAGDRISVSGTPRLGGIALAGDAGIELQGRLIASGRQLRLAVDRVRIGATVAPPLVRAVLERAINPLFDATAYPLPAQFDAVEVGDGTIRIAASGSLLPRPAP